MYTLIIVLLWSMSPQAHSALRLDGVSRAPEDSTSSFLGGVYGTYPILSKSGLKKLNEKTDRIEQKLTQREAERSCRLDSLNVLMLSDTVSIRKHSTFLGGLFTLPKLTDREKEAKSLRKKIADFQKEVEKLNEEMSKLKLEQKELKELQKKHEEYLEKRILWGFVSWEVKKKPKQ